MVPTVTCKVLVVGNAKCGKSSIISRFVNNRFSSDYRSTVGADYAMKDVALQGGRQVCVRCVCAALVGDLARMFCGCSARLCVFFCMRKSKPLYIVAARPTLKRTGL